MASSLPPDPYAALGVPKNADAGTIKSTYRKLVLRCHPDKVTDESLKKQKQEEFHKIQQAYELIGDEEKRATYDAEVRLNELRKEKLARAGGAPNVEIRTAHYDVRTAAPAGATFGARGPSRYEERKPSRSYDEDRYYEDRSSSRKYDTYEAYPKRSSPPRTSRSEREPTSRTTRVTSDRTRTDVKKSRDKDERREHGKRFVYVSDESSSDEKTRAKARYEAEYRRRTEEAHRQADEDEARKQAAEARRKAEDRRSSEEPRRHRSDDRDSYDRQRKLSDLQNDAINYIGRAKAEADPRPSPSRTGSSREVRPDYFDSRTRRDRLEAPRRSSARPKESSRPESSGRDSHRDRKTIPEIVEWEPEDRKIPPFKHSVSSPPELHVPHGPPQRSYTESSRDHRRKETSPTPVFRRSETMPTVHTTTSYPSSSSRRKEATPVRPSGLRSSEAATPHDSGYSSPGTPETTYPTVPPAQSSSTTKKVYHYPTPGGGVRLTPEDMGVANGHRTVLREPEKRHRTRSPSPLSRPPMGANRPVEASSTRYQVQPAAPAPPRTTSHTIPPTLGRSTTINEDRGRSHKLYGEINSDYTRRENARNQTSFSPDRVSYSKMYGPEDIRWSGGKTSDREYTKPSLSRHATYVY
ncbi:DnaJ-domain-containing protein [Zopfia rhizophila CBS 207.26]|uniref:DnaJ-domain-containing protein n=1 Tax=Zopfia rhizophila CBS 207.26 TaxID=1314779 RepID=A0A6A6EW10_9PEZI|nr:DnaJ-domain-containing protein [Zopfia rhizophila CBS 207.26]